MEHFFSFFFIIILIIMYDVTPQSQSGSPSLLATFFFSSSFSSCRQISASVIWLTKIKPNWSCPCKCFTSWFRFRQKSQVLHFIVPSPLLHHKPRFQTSNVLHHFVCPDLLVFQCSCSAAEGEAGAPRLTEYVHPLVETLLGSLVPSAWVTAEVPP